MHRASGGSPAIRLKAGRERSLQKRHPWVFSGAIEQIDGDPQAGATVAVRSASGTFLAWAAYSPSSQIRARIWSFDEADQPDAAGIAARVRNAIARRTTASLPSTACRLVHAEADGLPGLVVDRYGDWLVLQITATAAEYWRDVIVSTLREVTGCAQLYERSDGDSRALEGLSSRVGRVTATGDVTADIVPAVEILEHDVRYRVDIVGGQKTGFFLDQRDNRATMGSFARDRDVLNCFCYTGGFTLSALRGGARSVLSIDSSAPALVLAGENATLNGLDSARATWLEADVFASLRRFAREGRQFDLVVLDPPKFAPSSRDAERAARGYKDINLHALRLLRSGGRLATFSCSSGVTADLFQKIVAGAAADAGVSCEIEKRFFAAADHPVLLEFPEGEYLKGLLLRRS